VWCCSLVRGPSDFFIIIFASASHHQFGKNMTVVWLFSPCHVYVAESNLNLTGTEVLISFWLVNGYWLDSWDVGVWVPVVATLFSSPRRPNQFCCSHSLLSNRYKGTRSSG
jgi:hypothetical protein